jgi:arabinose-5-phosphate isomerase
MASTTMQLLWGDVLAADQMVRRGFTQEHFARYHPGGSLGIKLMKIRELMHRSWPTVGPRSGLVELLQSMSDGKLGMTTVMERNRMLGVISDVDLQAADIMTAKPVLVDAGQSAMEAAAIMEAKKITFLMVGQEGAPEGVLHIHDLLEAKVL